MVSRVSSSWWSAVENAAAVSLAAARASVELLARRREVVAGRGAGTRCGSECQRGQAGEARDHERGEQGGEVAAEEGHAAVWRPGIRGTLAAERLASVPAICANRPIRQVASTGGWSSYGALRRPDEEDPCRSTNCPTCPTTTPRSSRTTPPRSSSCTTTSTTRPTSTGANTTLEKLGEARDSGDFGTINQLEKNLAFHLSGHVLHSLFWKNLSPDGGGEPEGELGAAINEQLRRRFDAFRSAAHARRR